MAKLDLKCSKCNRVPAMYETSAAKGAQPEAFPVIVNHEGYQVHLPGYQVVGDSLKTAVLTCADCLERGVEAVNGLKSGVAVVAAAVKKAAPGKRSAK